MIDYIRAFQTRESIEEIWAFLVTDVDEKLAERLKLNNFTPLFSIETPIYHQYYDELGASITVVGARSLILDAEARNKIFIEIINKQSRLSRLLSKPKEENGTVREKLSKEYKSESYSFWWDFSPGFTKEADPPDNIKFIKEPTGESCIISTHTLLSYFTEERKTSRGKGNWGVKVLNDKPDMLAFEPPKGSKEWLFLKIRWEGRKEG